LEFGVWSFGRGGYGIGIGVFLRYGVPSWRKGIGS
jgi:hypothetical protein